MDLHNSVSTGMPGFDQVIDCLRLGDNVVWQVDSEDDYKKMAESFARQAKQDGRNLIYVRFGSHEPVLSEDPYVKIFPVDASKGFESFATEVHRLVKQEGRRAFYVFDCLTDLLKYWYSDLMIGNFFRVTCPYLYELDTVAYFAIRRNAHTYSTIAGIRETTQLLLDLYTVDDRLYIHPLKVWQRYSSTMFFPHLIEKDKAVSITSSSEAAELFSSIRRGEERLDYWNVMFGKARETLDQPPEQQEAVKDRLMSMIIGSDSRMFHLCKRYFELNDILKIASREVGTGFIGGKSVGMLVARKILKTEGKGFFTPFIEPHDSYYIGSDVFYTYIVQNGWWRLRTKQKTRDGYYRYAPELKEKLLSGKFPKNMQEQFVQLLEYFGQSPIIVRSSSLLEDNFGNAFAGKYESVFCANQGTPDERYEAFEQAIRTVYASCMNEDALAYRMNRGLFERDEQMAILVQRVSGDRYDECFFPHIAGVGNSSNLYVWDSSVDMSAGMLRMVFGLGTRAVDRTVGDYARIVCLDDPLRTPPVNYEDQKKFSQHFVDVISLQENALKTKNLDDIIGMDLKTDAGLFAHVDIQSANWLRERGYTHKKPPYILDFDRLLRKTEFAPVMKKMLAVLTSAYQYPVDIEFSANFDRESRFHVNLLQCRPLQTKGLGKPVTLPSLSDENDCFFSQKGNFMGGNIRLPIDYVILVQAQGYLKRNEQGKYAVARQIGILNSLLKDKSVLLIGPGRWGTTTPSLGVPVHFTELCHMAAVCEVASGESGFMPEVSYGSHFFQDIVESGIFYAAIFDGQKDVRYHPERILERTNQLTVFSPASEPFADVIHIAKADGMELFSDIVSQTLLCR